MNEQVTTHQAEDDVRNETILIWVNGRLLPRAEAVVSVYDSGFMLGDGVWEGLRLYDGRWSFLDEHLDRLFEAALAIDIKIGRDRTDIIAALEETRVANGMKTDAHARLMVTRVLPHLNMFPWELLSPHRECCREPTGLKLHPRPFPRARPLARGAFRRGAEPSASAAPRRKAPRLRRARHARS